MGLPKFHKEQTHKNLRTRSECQCNLLWKSFRPKLADFDDHISSCQDIVSNIHRFKHCERGTKIYPLGIGPGPVVLCFHHLLDCNVVSVPSFLNLSPNLRKKRDHHNDQKSAKRWVVIITEEQFQACWILNRDKHSGLKRQSVMLSTKKSCAFYDPFTEYFLLKIISAAHYYPVPMNMLTTIWTTCNNRSHSKTWLALFKSAKRRIRSYRKGWPARTSWSPRITVFLILGGNFLRRRGIVRTKPNAFLFGPKSRWADYWIRYGPRDITREKHVVKRKP